MMDERPVLSGPAPKEPSAPKPPPAPRSWLKTGVLIAGGGIVLAVGGVGALLFLVDPNDHRDRIAAELQAATGRAVTLAGPITLSRSLSPALVVEGVTLANMPGGSRPQMATIGRLEVQVALVPLILNGRLQVEKLALSKADILLETDAKGQGNWMFSPEPSPSAPAGTPAPTVATSGEGRVANLPILKEVLLTDSRLVYRSGKTQQRLDLSRLSLALPDGGKPVPVSIKASLNDAPFDLAGEIGALASLVAAEGAYPVKLKGQVAGLDLEAAGTLGLGKQQGQAEGNFTVSGENLTVLKKAVGGFGVASATWPDKLPKFTLTSQAALAGDKLTLTRAVLTTGKTEATATGTVQLAGPSFGLTITARSPDLKAQLMALGRLETAFVPEAGASLTAKLTGTATAPQLSDLVLDWGVTRVTGRVGVDTAAKLPRVTADLASPEVDITPFFGKANSAPAGSGGGSAAPAAAGRTDDRVIPDTPIDLAAITQAPVEGDVKLAVGRLKFGRGEVKDASLAVTLRNQQFTLRPLRFTAAEGKVALDAVIEPRGKLWLTGEAAGIDTAQLSALLGEEPVLKAKADLGFKASVEGKTLRALAANFDGSVNFATGPGQVVGSAADVLSSKYLAFLSLKPADVTNLTCTIVRTQFVRGQGTVQQMAVDTPGLTLRGTGGLSLASEALDLSFDPQLAPGNPAQLALVPFHVRGSFAKPAVSPDAAGTARAAVGIAQSLGLGGQRTQGTLGIVGALLGQQSATPTAPTGQPGTPCGQRVASAAQPLTNNPAQPGQIAPQPAKPAANDPAGAIKGLFRGLLGGSN
ncbi:MAG: AsmA family protein [Elstera sp.]